MEKLSKSTNMKGQSELSCALQLGLGTLCMTTGYDTLGMLAETFMSEQHKINPEDFGEHTGYMGQSVTSVVYMLSSLFVSFLLLIMSPKWILFASSICFTIFSAGFIHINLNLFYISCISVGLGSALKHAGTGIYLAGHSTKESLERNTAIVWGIGCFCFLVGSATTAMAAYFTTGSNQYQFSNQTNQTVPAVGKSIDGAQGQQDSIHLPVAVVCTVISILSNVTFFFLPTQPTPRCIDAGDMQMTRSIRAELKQYVGCLGNVNFWLLAPLFVLSGLQFSFFISIVPTALNRTSSLGIYSTAIYILAIGAGGIASSLLVSALPKKKNSYSVWTTLVLSVATTMAALVIVLIYIPDRAAKEELKDAAGSVGTVALTAIGLLLGSTDATINTGRSVVMTLALGEHRSQAFPLSKFIQSASSAVLLCLGAYLTVTHYVIILSASNLIMLISCFFLNRRFSFVDE